MNKTHLLMIALLGLFSSIYAAGKAQPSKQRTASAPAKTLICADGNFSTISEVNTKLRVSFSWKKEAAFCTKLAKHLIGKAVVEKADMILGGKTNAAIVIDPEFEILDKSGNYVRAACKQLTLSIVSGQKVYASTVITPGKLPRKLGLQNAKDQYLASVLKEAVPFLKKELDKLSRNEIAVSVIDFKIAKGKLTQQVARLAGILERMPGILEFANIFQDVQKSQCSFRVVYIKDRYPQGLANVINLKLSGK